MKLSKRILACAITAAMATSMLSACNGSSTTSGSEAMPAHRRAIQARPKTATAVTILLPTETAAVTAATL